MLAVLQGARSSGGSALAIKGEKGTGKGKDKGKGKEAAGGESSKAVLKKVVPVLASIDRRLATLEDRASYVFILRSEEWKKDVVELRALWKQQDKKRREEYEGAMEEWKANGSRGKRPAIAEHPLGGSQRSVIFKLTYEKIEAEMPEENPKKPCVRQATSQPPSNIDTVLYRFQPNHYEHREQRPWVWAAMVTDHATDQQRVCVATLYDWEHVNIRVAPQHSQGGPILKWLRSWMKKNGDGGGGRTNQDHGDEDDEQLNPHQDDERSRSGGGRKKKRGRRFTRG